MPNWEIVDFLATVPLLEGQQEADLVELARVMRPRTYRKGQIVWRQGDHAQDMLVIVNGSLSALLDVPGDRTVEIARAGPGEAVGEIGLLGGDGRATSMRVTETATVLALGRLDFAALVARQHPSAFSLKRRLALLLTTRVRAQLQHLAASLGSEVATPAADAVLRECPELEPCPAPDSKYIRRMATFHDFEPVALWGFLTSGSYVMCPPGLRLLVEGARSPAYYLTINGAVEQVLVRGNRRIRVGLSGPGKAFGYEGLIDGHLSPVTAIARERALLLVVPRDLFTKLFNGEDAVSRGFLDAVLKDQVISLREKLRPFTRLAMSA
jgi:CRP/FNR family transcriptional regulator, cyclic AMP receptor protein